MDSILLIYAPGGPPLDYVVNEITKRAELHVLITIPPSDQIKCYLVERAETVRFREPNSNTNLIDDITEFACAIRATAIVTFSEFAIEPVAKACTQLGLKGPGDNVGLARDKIEMRNNWLETGLYQPHFVEVFDSHGLQQTVQQHNVPMILKVANGAGSIGQQIVTPYSDFEYCFAAVEEAVAQAQKQHKYELSGSNRKPRFLAETVIQSSTLGWYSSDTLGDYLSVEGLVVAGTYHPLAITSRLPTIPPFIETTNLAPCPLEPDKKAKIVKTAKIAVDALGLEYCATHTELKLMKDGQVGLIETAARMGGVAIVKEIQSVFNIDYVGLLLDVLLNKAPHIPRFEENEPIMAAASLSMIGADSKGNPWGTNRIFHHCDVDWAELGGSSLHVTVEPFQSLSAQSVVPPYDKANGVLTNAGIAFVTAPDLKQLIPGLINIMDGLEFVLPKETKSN